MENQLEAELTINCCRQVRSLFKGSWTINRCTISLLVNSVIFFCLTVAKYCGCLNCLLIKSLIAKYYRCKFTILITKNARQVPSKCSRILIHLGNLLQKFILKSLNILIGMVCHLIDWMVVIGEHFLLMLIG